MTTFEQGWGARPFKEQFPQLDDEDAAKLDEINGAITLLFAHGVLTYSMTSNARSRLPRVVAEALRNARPRTGRLTRSAPKPPEQPGWWYYSPEAWSMGPFDTEAAMELDIAERYNEASA